MPGFTSTTKWYHHITSWMSSNSSPTSRITSIALPSLNKPPLLSISSRPNKALDPDVEIRMYRNYSQRIDDATIRNLKRRNQCTVFESESLPAEIHEANTSSYDIGNEFFEGLSYNDPRAEYKAYAAFHGMKMNIEAWSSLSKADQDGWDKISQPGKDTILCSQPPLGPVVTHTVLHRTTGLNPFHRLSAHLHAKPTLLSSLTSISRLPREQLNNTCPQLVKSTSTSNLPLSLLTNLQAMLITR